MTSDMDVVKEQIDTDVNAQNAVVTEQHVTTADAASEKMVPQSKVNEIVGAAKKSAYDKAYHDARSTTSEPPAQLQSSSASVEDIVSEKMREHFEQIEREKKKAQDEVLYASKLEEAKKTLSSLSVKVEKAAEKYEDFEEATKDIPYQAAPWLLSAVDKVDNSGEVLYHLGKNPSKFRSLARDLEDPKSPYFDAAMKDMQELSSTLKNNESAKQRNVARSPLSHVQPSNVGTDNGKLSKSDLRKKWTV